MLRDDNSRAFAPGDESEGLALSLEATLHKKLCAFAQETGCLKYDHRCYRSYGKSGSGAGAMSMYGDDKLNYTYLVVDLNECKLAIVTFFLFSEYRHPLPDIKRMLQVTAGDFVYSKCDALKAFNQMLVEEEDVCKTAVRTPDDYIEYLRVCFGLLNVPMVFQQEMERAL